MAYENQRKPPALGVVGAAGRMGQMLMQAVCAHGDARLGGVTEHPGHPWIGKTLAELFPQLEMDTVIHDDPETAFADSDAIIDFSTPASSVRHAEFAASCGKVHVIGTTGLTEEDLQQVSTASRSTVVIRAGNMSLGVNLLVKLTETVARALGPEFDIEIVEHHHRHKVDAPSGTALMLGVAAAKGRDLMDAERAFVRGRDGITGPREAGAIGYAAVRGGDVVGEHDVIFAGPGERLFLRHVATDRNIYAHGAVNAALWGMTQKPGAYDMHDVLGLGR